MGTARPPGKSERAVGSSPAVRRDEAREAPRAQDQAAATGQCRSDGELLASLGLPSLPEHTGRRALPWPVDVLLYPSSVAGLIHLVALVLFVLGLAVGRRFAPGLVRPAGWLFLIPLVASSYFVWYLAECVHDSARGGTRVPNLLSAGTDLADARSRVAYLAAEGTLYILPAVLYPLFTHRLDATFWALATWALVFAPVGLLAMVVLDSTEALNPLFLLGSILRAFVPYLGLLALVAAWAGLVGVVVRECARSAALGWPGALGVVIGAYGTFILAHALGRFYWRCRERLDWGL